jgi:hypothetical protein
MNGQSTPIVVGGLVSVCPSGAQTPGGNFILQILFTKLKIRSIMCLSFHKGGVTYGDR